MKLATWLFADSWPDVQLFLPEVHAALFLHARSIFLVVEGYEAIPFANARAIGNNLRVFHDAERLEEILQFQLRRLRIVHSQYKFAACTHLTGYSPYVEGNPTHKDAIGDLHTILGFRLKNKAHVSYTLILESFGNVPF